MLPLSAGALEYGDIDIEIDSGVINVEMTFSVDAPADAVIAALTRYEFPDPLYPQVTAKEILQQGGSVTRIRTEFRGCLMIFCRNSSLVQDVRITGNTVVADIVADGSDFSAGSMRWQVLSKPSGGSEIVYDAEMVPDFFIVPLVGKAIMRRKLRKEMLETAANLGRIVEQPPG